LNKEHAATLTQVERLAGVFGVEPWQLLAPSCGTYLYTLSRDQRMVPIAAPILDVASAAPPPPSAAQTPSATPRTRPRVERRVDIGINLRGKPSKDKKGGEA
jgi:hypothetical protein